MWNLNRKIIKILIDACLLNFSIILTIFFKYDKALLDANNLKIMLVYNIVFIIFYLLLKIYNSSWRFTGIFELFPLISLDLLVSIFSYGFIKIFDLDVRKTLVLGTMGLFFGFLILIRFLAVLTRMKNLIKSSKEDILVYGAGEAGVSFVKETRINKNFSYNVVGFIDDDKTKINTKVYGLKVLGNLENLKEILKKKDVNKMIICMPSIGRNRTREILEEVNQIENLEVKILPSLDEFIENNQLLSQVRNVKLEDLLGREEIKIDSKEVVSFIEGKTVFVTGGGGSIGSELIRQIAKFNPKKIINIEINENSSYFLELEIKRQYPYLEIITEITNVREKEKLEFIFEKYKPNILFHTAAHKHVPLMEHNPEEAIKNNIFGTKNIAECCLKYKVEEAILISTDKAVNPTNIMGATKRVCEMIFQKISEKESSTKFSAVRFGNVLGSNGSVIPIFSKLIEEGKNLTLTHKEITRYFMTIPEAAQLVIQAGTFSKGGEIFILDMGEPIKIYDLAKNMIKLSGAEVSIDIIGLRPGEKLYEELLYDVNSSTKTKNKKIFITNMENEKSNLDIENYYEKLEDLVKNNDKKNMRKILADIIGTFKGEV
ncbi:MAG: polysaccharide biosynthesis protein [Fusobacterium sp.]|nr:polysaccharide biosynthesis protein [Fusobacterium sp.]